MADVSSRAGRFQKLLPLEVVRRPDEQPQMEAAAVVTTPKVQRQPQQLHRRASQERCFPEGGTIRTGHATGEPQTDALGANSTKGRQLPLDEALADLHAANRGGVPARWENPPVKKPWQTRR